MSGTRFDKWRALAIAAVENDLRERDFALARAACGTSRAASPQQPDRAASPCDEGAEQGKGESPPGARSGEPARRSHTELGKLAENLGLWKA